MPSSHHRDSHVRLQGKAQLSIKYVGCFESNASYLFPWKLQQILRAQKHCLIEKILSYKTLFFNIVTTIGCAFLPAMNVLQATFVAICVTGGDPLSLSPLLKHATHRLTMLTSTVCSPETFSKCWWMSTSVIFSTWRNSIHTFSTRINGLKFEHRKCHTNMWKNFFMVRVTEHWNKLPTEVEVFFSGDIQDPRECLFVWPAVGNLL